MQWLQAMNSSAKQQGHCAGYQSFRIIQCDQVWQEAIFKTINCEVLVSMDGRAAISRGKLENLLSSAHADEPTSAYGVVL